jgi:TatD DNase family protein
VNATWHDAHLHLDFFSDPSAAANDARTKGLSLLANSVLPEGFVRTRAVVEGLDNVHAGLGLHPWWVAKADLAAFDQRFDETRVIGEVGLDLSPKRPHHDLQVRVFGHIARRCADTGNKVLSIHSVRAAGTVLDILDKTGCAKRNTCVFHWYSGSTEDLWRAIRMGCWFSVNEMQARTRRATEQLKLIPTDHLLLETDLPPTEDADTTIEDVISSLSRARKLLEQIRHQDMGSQLQDNWKQLTGLLQC